MKMIALSFSEFNPPHFLFICISFQFILHIFPYSCRWPLNCTTTLYYRIQNTKNIDNSSWQDSLFGKRKRNKGQNSTNHALFRKLYVCQESCNLLRQLQMVSGSCQMVSIWCQMVSVQSSNAKLPVFCLCVVSVWDWCHSFSVLCSLKLLGTLPV